MEMKLAAIYNVWDDWDLLGHSIKNIRPLVDGVIVVASEKSNFGEVSPIPQIEGVHMVIHEPKGADARDNETEKRNRGLDEARRLGYTHILTMDADEFYEPEPFLKEKKRFENPNLVGLVCRVKCYFKSPTLTIGYDTTLVPFIHRLTPTLRHEFNRKYPFAWTTVDTYPFTPIKKIRIDPTRSFNINLDYKFGEGWGKYDVSGVKWSEITMHHMSWVRKDVKKKIRNSTARQNIERSSIVQDYKNAREGYFCEFYRHTLEMSPNVFGLPEMHDTSI